MNATTDRKTMEVIIVGGSITGLMHGIVLKRLGHNVRILERSPSNLLESQGAGVSAMEKVQEFLSKHDLSKQPNFVPSEQVQFVDRAANISKVWKVPLSMTSWDTLYYRLRANFDGLSSEYVPQTGELATEKEGKAVYEHGTTVTALQEDKDVVTITFNQANGEIGSLQADLVIAADGPGSDIRKLRYPGRHRNYAGYVAWRGTVEERDVSEITKKVFKQNLTYYVHKGATILLYTIPGKHGSVEPGQRLLNWVWYCNSPSPSRTHTSLMTDTSNHTHRITVPAGKVRPEAWLQQKTYARQILAAPFTELVENTKTPFIQAITDIDIARPRHFKDKLLIVGDAMCAFRPHVGSSTNQAALHALLLEKVLTRAITFEQYEQECLDYATITSLTSVAWGNKNQFGLWTFVGSVLRLLWARLRLILRTPMGVMPTMGPR